MSTDASGSNGTEPWVPPNHIDVTLLPAGRWWDAVRVTRPLAERTLRTLGENSGAVIEDQHGALLYWLIEPGSADAWDDLPQVEVRGRASYVGVPPPGKRGGAGVRWRVPLAVDRYLTDTAALLAALEAAR